ncbi:unnamed protein product [Arabis nemorensis]|uniref:Uncharacterized protein n=1 Tax=Arabis nemorensis TaxID=586526 RepID=A0A565BN57_9BRAS|nr:unnamed protein product [Arabis nemorensis]
MSTSNAFGFVPSSTQSPACSSRRCASSPVRPNPLGSLDVKLTSGDNPPPSERRSVDVFISGPQSPRRTLSLRGRILQTSPKNHRLSTRYSPSIRMAELRSIPQTDTRRSTDRSFFSSAVVIPLELKVQPPEPPDPPDCRIPLSRPWVVLHRIYSALHHHPLPSSVGRIHMFKSQPCR